MIKSKRKKTFQFQNDFKFWVMINFVLGMVLGQGLKKAGLDSDLPYLLNRNLMFGQKCLSSATECFIHSTDESFEKNYCNNFMTIN